jgi:radical SAM superfamily enzyme YgiQ (UPF0313 family)
MGNVYLFQPQYSVEYQKETNYWLPYSVGCLWSYVSQFDRILENFTLADLFFKREKIEDVLDRIDNPKICGFSCYLWNENYCLRLAEEIKRKWPDCVIMFGGPQPTQDILEKYTFIDTVIFGEGEESFLSILDSMIKGDTVERVYSKSRLEDLNIPSPYTSGIFDNIVKQNPTAIWAMTLETNRGCPYACTFCDWGSVTYSKVKRFELERVRDELDWAEKNRVAYIFVADANFGMLKQRDLEIAGMIREVADRSMIESLNIQYAKNSTDIIYEIAKKIGPYSKGITVSVQSMNDQTLTDIKRKNLDINDIERVMRLSDEHGVSTYTEVILGLPNETLESWKEGLAQLLELGQHQNIDIWFAQLLGNSEMANPFSRRTYGIKTIFVEDYLTLDQSEDGIKEYVEIVNATNTMDTDDIVEAYLYTWMIIHFHINGYVQLIARYANKVLNIPYRKFYDLFFQTLKSDSIFGSEYTKVQNILKSYLTTGKLPEDLYGGHAIHSMSYKKIYDNKEHVATLAMNILNDLSPVAEQSMLEIQNMFIYSSDKKYPIDIKTNYNLYTGKIEDTTYQFSNQIDQVITDFYVLRRKGYLKNTVTISNSKRKRLINNK